LRKITLSDRERKLIALLAQGHTDASAAKHLGISARSVTNILRSLMDRLGVENRFQLGLALGFLRKANALPPGGERTDADAEPP
jgi:LuxR family transcriptional regulator, transcriptional regulator of spore coat protein